MKFTMISALLAAAAGPLAQSHTIQLHGSGTTNPSKCLWLLMSQFQDRALLPTRMTYRAVGSSTGQFEFLGRNNTTPFSYMPYNDFGAGDIPISTEDYTDLKAKNIGFVHIPFVLGAITMFHSVPGVGNGGENGGLNLSPCVLARIFKRDITVWDHEDILKLNDGLSLPYEDYPITVAHRKLGSSSTSSITAYLHKSCPTEWPVELVGKTIDWPKDTESCEGSGGMTNCIRDVPGTIGYIDAGHGHDEGLIEIELRNIDGTFLSSKEAAAKGGIGAAAGAALPTSADADFGGVNLLNQPGPDTWPIVAVSYIYVRKDLGHMDDPNAQSLLKLFLKTLTEEETITKNCAQFGFEPVPSKVSTMALKGIDMITTDATAAEWIIETDTMKGGGQGDYVISKKRRSYVEYAQSSTTADVATAMKEVSGLQSSRSAQGSTSSKEMGIAFTENDEKLIGAAVAMSAISLVLWFGTATWFVLRTKGIVG
mmetsp:Transcript_64070/g.75063  ORF Transcript_64070/g.75063 Transcript_64070/m.75063 type:complete len:482 (-) Transcript_64070:418-1863(-)